ncbi:adenylate/guanylate cyclase domain-containing protein [Leptospira sp. GIMC2001]|uniref:adenylate/guanylate cyclase domain-containing protein n=1 Tax=Leptospira sp. GIMC2001 TaxID=1513297 RepID=UPI00234B18B6|nr:adenylate/guanylate cyclase domain-containing protein [Leptospira sp. GIMC2001]WCL49542.1 DUF5939 domain-containing protein [Leptospira sp. GIMC2001]
MDNSKDQIFESVFNNKKIISSITEFLNIFPWDNSDNSSEKPMDYLWTFTLAETPEILWPKLIDTSSFNKRLGLPEMRYQENNGKLYGESKNAGIQMEWEEVPWEWEYCKQMNNARIYSKGFARYVRTRYILYSHPTIENHSILLVYFGWIPRGLLGKIILFFGMQDLEKKYKSALFNLVQELRNNRLASNLQNTNIEKKHNPQSTNEIGKLVIKLPKLNRFGKLLIEQGYERALVNQLFDHILNSDDNDLYRIRVKELANQWSVPFRNLLEIFLLGCRESVFTLSWDVVCPHCRGVRTELQHLGDIPKDDSCDVCEIDFETNKVNSIEVSFHIHPSIRVVQKRFFCAAEPATKQHIYFQKHLNPIDNYSTKLHLETGTYRMRIGGDKKYSVLEVQNIPHESDNIKTEENLLWSPNSLPSELRIESNLNLQLKNPENHKTSFIIESRKEDQFSLRPADLFNFQNFRDLFAEETIANGLSLDIGIQTILFTDIVGSTKLYGKLGDAKAFSEVRKHFIEIYRIISENEGAVVKTIGDSVMASFQSPVQSVQASVAMQEYFEGSTQDNFLKIRITINSGPCLAVNFNSNIDYFGNTVNYSAKLQKFSNAGDIVFSESIFRDAEVRNFLRLRNFKLKKFTFTQEWDRTIQNQAYKLPLSTR